MKPKTADLARGKWKGILQSLGIEDSFLTGKHGPCPSCGGTDRFRFDNKAGSGSYICSGCGNGSSGFDLLRIVKGWDFKTAATEVDRVVGNVTQEKARPDISPGRRRDMLNRLWKDSVTVTLGDPVQRYLTSRHINTNPDPSCIRFSASCPVPGEPGGRWAMVAMVSGPDGRPVNLHRTFLGPNGKADIAQPRALMPGTIPDGSAVRLFAPAEHMGVAEGLETAMRASERFGLPVWAAINSALLAKWKPPEGCKRVTIFGDNDEKFGGQAATYALAHRLACAGFEVDDKVAPERGTDWADVA